MDFDFLVPVSDAVLAHSELLSDQTLGKKIKCHNKQTGFPDLEGVRLAIIGVLENRNDVNYKEQEIQLDEIRQALFRLYPGSWDTAIVDLGDIENGETVQDTYFAVKTVVEALLKKDIIPIILGGSQDLTYPNYRAYDGILPMVNLVNVDCKFNLGNTSKPIKNDNFVGKIILNEPHNLFNYTAIGYQTYFNSQEEKDLMDSLYFESYRLGELYNNIALVEPVMRDANMVSIDLKSVQASEVGGGQHFSPNGLNGREICAIARYAGISNKVSSFGVYEYETCKENKATAMLVAQIIWYFTEGVNCRVKDEDFTDEQSFQKFTTLTDSYELVFYKSNKTGRWWMEIPFLSNVNNKLKHHTLLPCMHQDYLDALNDKVPERWYKAINKNSV
ncbi:MAG: formimidoylglutamase [Aestuariibaculum sp.]